MRVATIGELLALLLFPAAAFGGEMLSWPEKILSAQTIAEVTLPFDRKLPKTKPGDAFPSGLVTRAQGKAKLGDYLYKESEKPPVPPKKLFPFSSGSKCWWRAHEQKAVTALVFFGEDGRQLRGVEEESGLHTSLNPDFGKLKEAIAEAKSWPEERARAVSAEMLWGAQRRILEGKRDNPYLPALAALFLKGHGASDVIDLRWGPKGSPDRIKKEAEALAAFEKRVCDMSTP